MGSPTQSHVPQACRRYHPQAAPLDPDDLGDRRGSSAVEHRPADLVAQPLIVKHKLANRLRKLLTLPPALTTPRGLRPALLRGGTGGLDRIGGSTQLVCGNVRNSSSLARSVGGMPSRPTQISRRTHRMTARRTRLHHLHLATHPGAGMLDRLTRSWVRWLSRLEEFENVLGARCRPQSEKVMIRVGEGPTAADRHEARVSHFREDHRVRCLLPTRGQPMQTVLG